jgi:hypothetical protein
MGLTTCGGTQGRACACWLRADGPAATAPLPASRRADRDQGQRPGVHRSRSRSAHGPARLHADGGLAGVPHPAHRAMLPPACAWPRSPWALILTLTSSSRIWSRDRLTRVRAAAGRTEPGHCLVFQAGVRGWGKTTVADRSPRSRRRRWITARSGTRCTPSRWINWRRSASQCSAPGRGVSSVARTWPISPPSSIPIARRRRLPQRGKAKQKRSDLRLADLGLVVARDGGIPLTWHASP